MFKVSTLSFQDDSWEAAYRSRHEELSERPRKLFLALGGFLMLSLIPLDPYQVGELAPAVWMIRLAVVALLVPIYRWISPVSSSNEVTHGLALSAVMSVLAANLLIMWFAGAAHYSHFQVVHVLTLLTGFWGLRVRWGSSLVPLAAATLVDALVLLGFRGPIQDVAADLLLAFAGSIAVVFTSYSWERHERQSFLDRMVIEDEQRLLREMNRALHRASVRDPLTGLLNRRSLHDRLDEALSLARRYGTESSLVIIDLDHFKTLNDTRGHAVGDLLLCRVAESLTGGIRETDFAFRMGGDEFCLLLPNTPLEQATDLTERILSDLRAAASDEIGSVSFSAGCVGVSDGSESSSELLHRADEQLYRAKRVGRGNVCTESHHAA